MRTTVSINQSKRPELTNTRPRPYTSRQRPDTPNTKHQGEWAELMLMTRAAGIGLKILKPYGDNTRYDVATEDRGKISRLQVKSVSVWRDSAYKVKIESVVRPRYESRDVDFIAVYCIPADAWYIIPIGAVEGVTTILLRPNRWTKAKRFEKYREAWHLLMAEGYVRSTKSKTRSKKSR